MVSSPELLAVGSFVRGHDKARTWEAGVDFSHGIAYGNGAVARSYIYEHLKMERDVFLPGIHTLQLSSQIFTIMILYAY